MLTNNVTKLRGFHCYKILPLVYDESLSYMELNCKVVQKLNEVIEQLENLSIDILDEAKAYTDSAIANQQTFINEKITELELLIENTTVTFNQKINELQTQYSQFTSAVNAQLTVFKNLLDDLDKKIDDSVIGVNARTDLKIEQNNEYIFEQIEEHLTDNLKVVNMFTGADVTIQEMFNYLGNLHVDDGIKYSALASRNITYTDYAGLGMTYTDLVLHGNTLIP